MRRLALMALFLVAACGSIGVQAHTISLAYKPGDTYKYAFHIALKYTIGAQGMSMPLTMDITAKEAVKVVSVDASGTGDLSVTLTEMSMKMTMAGTTNTTSTTTATTIEMKIASDGRIVTINGNTLGNNAFPGTPLSKGGILSAILPDKAVKPGDTWSKSFDQPVEYGSGSSHITTDNKYVKDESVGGVNAAVVDSKVKTTLDMTLDLSALAGSMGGSGSSEMPVPSGGISGATFTMKGTGSSDVQSWIDTSARRVVKTHSSGSLDASLTVTMPPGSATPGLAGPITIKGTHTLDLTPA